MLSVQPGEKSLPASNPVFSEGTDLDIQLSKWAADSGKSEEVPWAQKACLRATGRQEDTGSGPRKETQRGKCESRATFGWRYFQSKRSHIWGRKVVTWSSGRPKEALRKEGLFRVLPTETRVRGLDISTLSVIIQSDIPLRLKTSTGKDSCRQMAITGVKGVDAFVGIWWDTSIWKDLEPKRKPVMLHREQQVQVRTKDRRGIREQHKEEPCRTRSREDNAKCSWSWRTGLDKVLWDLFQCPP